MTAAGAAASGAGSKSTSRFVYLGMGVLCFHLLNSVLQEAVFHIPGYHHTLALSFLQTLGIAFFAVVEMAWAAYCRRPPPPPTTPLIITGSSHHHHYHLTSSSGGVGMGGSVGGSGSIAGSGSHHHHHHLSVLGGVGGGGGGGHHYKGTVVTLPSPPTPTTPLPSRYNTTTTQQQPSQFQDLPEEKDLMDDLVGQTPVTAAGPDHVWSPLYFAYSAAASASANNNNLAAATSSGGGGGGDITQPPPFPHRTSNGTYERGHNNNTQPTTTLQTQQHLLYTPQIVVGGSDAGGGGTERERGCGGCVLQGSGGGRGAISGSGGTGLLWFIHRRAPLRTYLLLSVFSTISALLTNEASHLLNYPTQVVFKSSKLFFVMSLRVLLRMTKAKSAQQVRQEFLSCFCIVVGLVAFTYATSHASHGGGHHHSSSSSLHQSSTSSSTSSSTVKGIVPSMAAAHLDEPLVVVDDAAAMAVVIEGVIAIIIALCCDAMLYIGEERYCFEHYKATNSEVILFTYLFAAAYSLGMLILSGGVGPAITFAMANPRFPLLILAFSVCNFCGTHFLLGVVAEFDSNAAVIVTSTRKMFTVLLSFVIYPKPFTLWHFGGLALVSLGIFIYEFTRVMHKKRQQQQRGGGGGGKD